MPFDEARYEELHHGGMIGSLVHYRDRTASTMDDARAGAAALRGEGCGDAYLTDEQTAGRGRFRRPWVDAPGASLLVTYHLCVLDLVYAPLVGLAGALAAADAVTETSGIETELKWPNDVLAGGRKLAGILAEAQPGGVEVDVFLGIGINIREAAIGGLSEAERAVATTIEGEGATLPSVEELLAALSEALERRMAEVDAEPERLLADWRARLAMLGSRVRLSTTDGEIEGIAEDVTAEGQLVLRLDGGGTYSFAAGDVTVL